jgi:hypothetical protein
LQTYTSDEATLKWQWHYQGIFKEGATYHIDKVQLWFKN